MFDRHDVIVDYVAKERIEKSLRKAARERIWEQEPRPAPARIVVAQVGGLLVMFGTRLQTDQHHPTRQRRVT